MLSVVHNYYYLLALLIIHSLRTSICVCKYLYMLSVTFDDQGGAGPMTLTFPSTSADPGPHSTWLKFYIYSAEIAIPLRVILIPVLHTCALLSFLQSLSSPFVKMSIYAIVEETLTSGKYVSLFLISILYIYIYNFKNYVAYFEEIRKNWQSEKIAQVKRTNAPYLLLIFKWKH